MLKVQSSKSLLRFIQSLNCNPKARQEIIWTYSKLYLCVWCQNWLQISNSFFIFVDCKHLLSPWLVPLPVSSFPQQIGHGSGILNILRSPMQLQCYNILFQCLKSTHDLLASRKGLVSLCTFCPLLHSKLMFICSSYGTGISNTLGFSVASRLHQ